MEEEVGLGFEMAFFRLAYIVRHVFKSLIVNFGWEGMSQPAGRLPDGLVFI